MPKLLVLFQSGDPELARLADAVAAGARGVRFTEVDVRRAGDAASATRHRALEHADELAPYDGVAVGVPARPEGSAVLAALDGFAGSLAEKVGAAFTSASWTERNTALSGVFARLAERGMLLVPVPPVPVGSPREGPESDATRLGARIAEVIGWIAHARSHQHHHHEHHDS
jgi:hypothetical protein